MAWNKPIPFVDEDIRPFYDGLKEGKFLLSRCTKCGAWYFPAAYCRNHANEPFMGEMEWVPASGRGTIATFNIHRVAFNPGFKADVPYAFVLAQLAEGPMFGTSMVDCAPEAVRVGMEVEVCFEDQMDTIGLVLPRFRPAQN